MNILKIQDAVEFELYDCIGIVLTVLEGKSFPGQAYSILTFNPRSKTILSRPRGFPAYNWYLNDCTVYQMLIGNHKAWISHDELKKALIGRPVI